MDPLSLLRQATISSTEINLVDGNYVFGPHRFHESTKTCFKRTLVTLKTGDYYYTVKDVIFFLENLDISFAEYRRKLVNQRTITAVVETDRKALKEYLTGVIDSCSQLDQIAAAAYLANASNVSHNEVGTAASASTTQISDHQFQEQRQRHAAILDQSIQRASASGVASTQSKSSSNAAMTGVSFDKQEEIRQLRRAQKRKEIAGEHKTEAFDSAFIQDDRKVLADLRANEQPALTRMSVLCKPGADFSFALKLFNDRILKSMHAAKSGTGEASAHGTGNVHPSKKPRDSSTGSTSSKLHGAHDNKSATTAVAAAAAYQGSPIIIVPSALTSCITSVNAQDFLEKGVYVTVEEKTKLGGKRESEFAIMRTVQSGSTSRKIRYKIIDNPKQLRPEDWNRVVAVFATGQAWQFKEFKWTNPAELFQNVMGVHLTMDDRAVDANIMSWNCKILRVFRFKQHLDAEASNEFWAQLDDFMRLHKPLLVPALS